MIIKFSNLGSIKETELDLRPLTIIIGPNNSNKTYVAYSIYGIWQNLAHDITTYSDLEFSRDGDSLAVKVDDNFVDRLIYICQLDVRLFTRELETFYQDSSRQLFSHTEFALNISREEMRQALERLSAKILRNYYGKIYKHVFENDVLKIYPNSNTSKRQPSSLLNDSDVISSFLIDLKQSLFSRPFLLPAERNAFIITYKMLANRRFKLLRESQRNLFAGNAGQRRQIEMLSEQGDIDIRYPQPIEDFLEFLTDIELEDRHSPDEESQAQESMDFRGEAEHENKFAALARQIEQYIQDGNKTEFKPTQLGGKEIMVNVKKGLQIDLYNASSSIKQLAPLLLYLRYRAAENDLLIIDEPEMNLHPESQVRLLEILAILVNAGVNVLLTTHSPYLMAHLNNLVQSDEKPDKVRQNQATSLYLKDVRAFLRMDQVSAYEMKDNKLQTLKDEAFGIRWDTLSDVSVEIQQKYFEIYQKGETRTRARSQRK